MNITLIESAWRRWQLRRPSEKTLRELRRRKTAIALETIKPAPWPPELSTPASLQFKHVSPRDPIQFKITSREASKYAFQNYALLAVLESHTAGYSHLSAGALMIVKCALNKCGTKPPDAA